MRIGLIGCGNWGSKILRDLVDLDCEVDVVARSAAASDRAEAGGAREVWSSTTGLPAVDGIIVATPASTHAAVVASLIDRGVPIFCEKPLATDSGAIRPLVEAASDLVFVMDKWRYHPGVEQIRDLVTEGAFGALRGVSIEFAQWGNRHQDVHVGWVMLPHVLAIALEITGTIPDFDFADGLRIGDREGELVAVSTNSAWCSTRVSTIDPEYRRRVAAHFDTATVILGDGYADHLVVRPRSSGEAERIPIETALPLERELEAFVGHLRGGPPPRSSAAVGLEVVGAIEALLARAGW